MNPSRMFILRPVATLLAMLALLLAGALAYRLLPQSALPEVDYPTIQVVTHYPGASPEVIATSVTAPLERQFGAIAGLTQLSSASSVGISVITLQFDLALTLDIAVQSVQAAINAAGAFLPRELPGPPVYYKVNPADAPVLTFAVTSDTLPLTVVQDLVDTRLAQKLSQVSGVGLVSLAGGQRPAVRIRADADALAAYGIGLDELRRAVDAANSNAAKGAIDGPQQTAMLDANSQLRSAEEYAAVVIGYRGGAPLRLTDVAQVREGAEDAWLAAWADEQPAILVNVQRQPGANVIAVVDRIHALLPELRAALPASVELRVLADRTHTIRASVRGVQTELVMAVSLVILVIFLFLRTLSATLIPSLAVPLSLVGTFAVMYAAGFSVNNLTLMALTIATGFVVDDAIVMIENIARHMEMGKKPLQAALDGSKQIAFTIISLTFSLIAVLIPLLFMADVVGRLFREFAVTLAVAILISAVVSLTLTPMLCARLLRHVPPERENRVQRAIGAGFERVVARYGDALRVVLRHQYATLGVALATLLLTVALAAWIPKGFFPVQDTGAILAITEAPQTVSFVTMAERQQALARHILQDPDVANLASIVGVDGVNATLNSGRLLINLRPHRERRARVAEIIGRLQALVDGEPGMRVFFQPVQDLTVDDRVARAAFQYLAESPDGETLERWVPRLERQLRALPQITDLGSNLQNEGLLAYVEVDRDRASRLGISLATVDEALYSAFGQRFISTVFTQTSQYRVILEARQPGREGLQALDAIHLPAAGGRQVPLSAVAQITQGPARLVVHREKQFPAATLSFNLAPGVALGEAVAAIDAAVSELEIPAGVSTRFRGAAQAFGAALANELFLILAALTTMYIVLGILYESAIHPLTILSTLPSAAVGALLALWATQLQLDVIAIIGIVQKNAIMMIDFALDAERNQRLPPREAIYQACLLRFRPILMTTLAALFSAVPLALGEGSGAELRRPLGIVLIGGLLLSQVLTLFTTPVVYLAFDRLARRLRAARRPRGRRAAVNLAAPFIRRPVATSLLALAVALPGLLALGLLPVASLPQVDNPTINVTANLPGASPEVVAATVATPLERAFGRIAGITEMTSASTQGGTRISLQFELDRDIDGAARDVQAAIDASRALLPPTLIGSPTYRKINAGSGPVLALALSSPTRPQDAVYDIASTLIAQPVGQVAGVGQIFINGSAQRSVRVEVDPAALDGRGVSLAEVRQALISAGVHRPSGVVEHQDTRWQIQLADEARAARDYRNLIVAWRNGAPVRLGEVGRVHDSLRDVRNAGSSGGRPAVMMSVINQPGVNILELVEDVKALLPRLQAGIPADVELRVVMDRSGTIRATVREIQRVLLMSVALAILIALAFLRSLRATLIPSIAIPVVLLGTLAVIHLLGFTLNNLSLMALIVAAGFVVDDAMVVMENISRHVESGLDRLSAALRGAREIGFTVLAANAALVAVLIPLLLMGGLVGRMFREFAVTLAVAVGISLLVSLSLTPMLCARWLSPRRPAAERPDAWARLAALPLRAYDRSLAFCLRHGMLMLGLLAAAVLLSLHLYQSMPKGFFPQQDTGRLTGIIRADQTISFAAMRDKSLALMRIVGEDPAMDTYYEYTGGSAGGATNAGTFFARLKPREQRDVGVAEVIRRLRPKLAEVPGATLMLSSQQDLNIGARPGGAQYQFTLVADELEPLRHLAPALLARMSRLEEIADVSSDYQDKSLQVDLVVDREAAARLGLSARQIDDALYDAFGQRLVSTLYEPLDQYYVVLTLAPEHAQRADALEHIHLYGAGGERVPLSAIARYALRAVPLAVNHQGPFVSATLSFNLAEGVALDRAMNAVETAFMGLSPPESVRGRFAGTAEAFRAALDRMPWLVLAALLIIYIVLGILYESFLHPLTILSTLPSAGVGALLALRLSGSEFSVIALIGVILLVGIAMKNAIILVDTALNLQREQGLAPASAVHHAALQRFRPIMMTTLAAMFVALPMVLALGDGSELRRPLGIAIAGGLVFSQTLTLYITPAVYLVLDRLRPGTAGAVQYGHA